MINQVSCIEDMYNDYIKNINYHMFFKKKLSTFDIIINILHVIGVIYIFIGMFLPPLHLPYYLLYILIILVCFKLFKNKCFLTEFISTNINDSSISDKNCKKSNLVKMKMDTIYKNLSLLIVLTLIGIFFPDFSLHSFLKNVTESMIPFSKLISYYPLAILIILITIYIIHNKIICPFYKNKEKIKGCNKI